ncbi:hypothetical protein HPB50_022676 [Hyalomma asiaticum]|uniref:Uncharacterized protein n=1 Tax=Hyalomma asiaticum TaxID=266040 RepID=A0ACB7SZ17_HYAAI|nr:hypothetical protein HPB50_022676 [Hyalomma asiaticum]
MQWLAWIVDCFSKVCLEVRPRAQVAMVAGTFPSTRTCSEVDKFGIMDDSDCLSRAWRHSDNSSGTTRNEHDRHRMDASSKTDERALGVALTPNGKRSNQDNSIPT